MDPLAPATPARSLAWKSGLLLLAGVAACAPRLPAGAPPSPAAPPESAAPAAVAPVRVYMAFYERGPAWNPAVGVMEQRMVQEHIAHHRALGARRIGAAPFTPDSTDVAVGAVVFVAPSPDSARAWLAADPAVQAGVLRGKIRRWHVGEIRAVAAPAQPGGSSPEGRGSNP